MSWLRDHFHHFVYPAFIAAEKKSSEIGAPFHIETSKHAPERLPPELRKLWTLCKQHGIEWSYDVRAINWHGGNSKYRDTARAHQRILRNSLDSACAAMKREGRTRLLFPGRDIYMLVPVCARRGIPFLFVPELSRPNSSAPAMRDYLLRLGLDGHEMLVDTGYYGTIPANLNKMFPEFEFDFRLLSEDDKGDPRYKFHSKPHQLFANRRKARDEACETEYLSKYWKSGTTDAEGNIVQYLADKRSIQRAALLTAMLFRGIPYWKVAKEVAQQRGIQHYQMGNQVNFGLNPVMGVNTIITSNVVGTATTITAGTFNMTTGGVIYGPPQFVQTPNQVAAPPTPLTQNTVAAALAAVPKLQAPALPPAPPAQMSLPLPPAPPPPRPIPLLPPAPPAPPVAVAV